MPASGEMDCSASLAIVSWLWVRLGLFRESGTPWFGWPSGPRRGQIDRLAIGRKPAVILVVCPLPLQRLMS